MLIAVRLIYLNLCNLRFPHVLDHSSSHCGTLTHLVYRLAKQGNEQGAKSRRYRCNSIQTCSKTQCVCNCIYKSFDLLLALTSHLLLGDCFGKKHIGLPLQTFYHPPTSYNHLLYHLTTHAATNPSLYISYVDYRKHMLCLERHQVKSSLLNIQVYY
jgi:hypothetical protein